MRKLTGDEYDRVRNLVRRSPVFIGMRIVVRDDNVEVLEPDDLVFGLGPVVEAVHGTPPDQWPDVVDECLRRILTALTDGSPELDGPAEHFLDRVFARLRPADGSPTEWWNYATEVAPGLLVVLALDHPDHVAILNDAQVRKHGVDRLFEAGLGNLCHQLPDTYAVNENVYLLTGEDYVASTVLVMPWVVEAVTGSPGYPNGVLVAVPDHKTLVFSVVDDGPGARFAMAEIARVAAERYESDTNPISRFVYWLAPDAGYLQPVAHHAGDDGVIGADLVVHDAGADLMARLG
jgi:hypothetical protein